MSCGFSRTVKSQKQTGRTCNTINDIDWQISRFPRAGCPKCCSSPAVYETQNQAARKGKAVDNEPTVPGNCSAACATQRARHFPRTLLFAFVVPGISPEREEELKRILYFPLFMTSLNNLISISHVCLLHVSNSKIITNPGSRLRKGREKTVPRENHVVVTWHRPGIARGLFSKKKCFDSFAFDSFRNELQKII